MAFAREGARGRFGSHGAAGGTIGRLQILGTKFGPMAGSSTTGTQGDASHHGTTSRFRVDMPAYDVGAACGRGFGAPLFKLPGLEGEAAERLAALPKRMVRPNSGRSRVDRPCCETAHRDKLP